MTFIKTKENFVCQNCGREVVGDGYTNHCPKCLYSKHVDVSPGDRSESCGGLMKPVSAQESGGEWSVLHKCLKCEAEKKNKVSKEDDFGEVVKISAGN